MLVNCEDSVLLVIDVQTKLLSLINENQLLCENINRLIEIFDKLKLPIIITEQYPRGLGHTSEKIIEPKELYSKVEKTTFSCYSDTIFKDTLSRINKKKIIICGIETHICVLQTAIELKENGYNVFVVSDSVNSRRKVNYESGMKRLAFNQINIIDTEMFLFELLRDSKHESFRELSKLIK